MGFGFTGSKDLADFRVGDLSLKVKVYTGHEVHHCTFSSLHTNAWQVFQGKGYGVEAPGLEQRSHGDLKKTGLGKAGGHHKHTDKRKW